MAGCSDFPVRGSAQARRQLVADGSLLQPGDYLSATSAAGENRTLFVASLEPLQPILAISCNALVSLSRGTLATDGRADAGYAAQPGGGSALLDSWPASLLAGSGPPGPAAKHPLPGNPIAGGWTLLLPRSAPLGGIMPAAGDRILARFLPDALTLGDPSMGQPSLTDQLRRFVVTGAELGDLGWRLGLSLPGL